MVTDTLSEIHSNNNMIISIIMLALFALHLPSIGLNSRCLSAQNPEIEVRRMNFVKI